MKQSDTVKKLAMAGVLTAVAVVGSLLSFPIFGSKCAPVQHMVNILLSRSQRKSRHLSSGRRSKRE